MHERTLVILLALLPLGGCSDPQPGPGSAGDSPAAGDSSGRSDGGTGDAAGPGDGFGDAAAGDAAGGDTSAGDVGGGDAGGLQPTAPMLLTPPNAGTHDEDPSILRAQDGSFFLAWLSDRDGNDDIYIMRSPDGVNWGNPVRVTRHDDPDWYPHLIQDSGGRFHLTWFRAMTVMPFYRHVYANSSADGLTWDSANEVQVSSGVADDWAPMVLQQASGDLLAYFSSQARGSSNSSDLYLSRSVDQGATWSAPQELIATSTSDHEVFPYVAQLSGAGLVMVFVRYLQAGGQNYWDPSTDLMFSSSTDGLSWTAPEAITDDDTGGFVDSIPSLYSDPIGVNWRIAWTSTGPTAPATVKIQELALSDLAAYPQSAIDVTATRGAVGYSVRAAATGTTDLYLGVWTRDDAGTKRIFWQVFTP